MRYTALASIACGVGRLFGENIETRIVVSADARPAALGQNAVVLLDPDREAHDLCGANVESLYLVRPDGYVGFRSQPAEEEPLLQCLGDLCALRTLKAAWISQAS